MNLINQIHHNQSPTIKGFGLSLDEKFVKVPARLLDAPKIQYANGTVQPQKGAWRGENMKFLDPMGTNTCKIKWGILNTNYRTNDIEIKEFASMVWIIRVLQFISKFSNFISRFLGCEYQ